MELVLQKGGNPTPKIGGQEAVSEHVQGECSVHGVIRGRLLSGGRLECPECVANQARIDAMNTGIPPRFILKNLNEYQVACEDQADALKTAQGYAENFKEARTEGAGLVFLGSVGTGKTHLACGIANYVRKKGASVRYSTVRHILDTLRSTWGRDSQMSKAEALGQFIGPDLLILDEVGVQYGTPAERIDLYEVIDGRYGHIRPTIIISNLSLEEFENVLGTRVVDRMRENGHLMQFNWASHRR